MSSSSTNNKSLNIDLQNTLESILLLNQQGVLLDCNVLTKTVFGWAQEEIIGKNVDILFDEYSGSIVKKALYTTVVLTIFSSPQASCERSL